jgi:hypothetical protein
LQDEGATARALAAGGALFVFAYNPQSSTGRYVACDGRLVSCFSLVGVSRSEAAAVAKACERNTDWSLSAFQETASRTLGGVSGNLN